MRRLGLNDWWAVERVSDGLVFHWSLSSTRGGAIAEYSAGIGEEDTKLYQSRHRLGLVRCVVVTIAKREE